MHNWWINPNRLDSCSKCVYLISIDAPDIQNIKIKCTADDMGHGMDIYYGLLTDKPGDVCPCLKEYE